ncbi:MAG TPA: IS200/IS605 family transposase [Gemmatimonadales bacterium]|nr:IS200/IS605 family transposase [Gemmatimonadales bacterium]
MGGRARVGVGRHGPAASNASTAEPAGMDGDGKEGNGARGGGIRGAMNGCRGRVTAWHYESMSGRYTCVRVHFVWTTKRRQPWLDPRWRPRLYGTISTISERKGGRLLCAGGVADHVHLYVDCPTTLPISEMVRAIKANSSRWIRTSYPEHRSFEWQAGYAAFSVDPIDDRRLREYIRTQEIHHRERGFLDEYLELLDRHGIEYNIHGALE